MCRLGRGRGRACSSSADWVLITCTSIAPEVPDDPVDHGAGRELGPTRPPGRTHDQLSRALGPGDVQEGYGNVSAGGLDVATPELGQQRTMLVEELLRRSLPAVFVSDVDTDQLRPCTRRYPCGTTDEMIATGRACERHQHALTGLPRPIDAVTCAVLGEGFVDAIGNPEERELPQCRQVAFAEVVPECGVDPLRCVDVAVRHPAPESLGSHVDQLDLVGRADPGVGHGLSLLDARDGLDDVVERLEVLDVHRRDHIDAGLEQLLDVLPPLRVAAPWDVRVRELVDESDRRPTSQHRVEVHLLEGGAAIVDLPTRDDLEIADLFECPRPAMGLHEGDHDVGTPSGAAATLVEHRERLADAWGCAHVDPKRSPCHGVDSCPLRGASAKWR